MAGTTKAVKSAAEQLADKADVAATWVTGPRRNALNQLAEDLRALGQGDTSRLDKEREDQEAAAAAAKAEQEAAAAAREASRLAAEEAKKAADQQNS